MKCFITKHFTTRIQYVFLYTTVLLLLFPCDLNAQWQNGLWTAKQANTWPLNPNFGIEFGSGSPSTFSGVQLDASEGSTAISDDQGQLLFYAGKDKVWNKNHQVMLNGEFITGSTSSTQFGVIVPKPGSSTIFYLFTVNEFMAATGLTYSEIDLSLDGGLGGVTSNKNIVLDPNIAGEKITAIYHADKQRVWVITHRRTGDEFAAFLVSSEGISATGVVSAAGLSYPAPSEPGGTIACSQIKASPDGTRIASVVQKGPDKGIQLFSFNNQTGIISYITHMGNFSADLYGVEFSPNSRFLYTSDPFTYGAGGHVTQYDVSTTDPLTIENSKYTLGDVGYNFNKLSYGMQLAPNGKIYLRNCMGLSLNVIDFPNNPGTACGYHLNSVPTGSVVYSLPTFNQTYLQSGILTENLCFGKILFSTIRIPDITAISWDFGDPASGEDNISDSPLHSYTQAGTYTITATIVSNEATQFASTTITIEDPNDGIISPADLAVCGETGASYAFDLTQQTAAMLSMVSQDGYQVTYYTSYDDATNGSSPIDTTENFLSLGQTIYVQIMNVNTGCILIKMFNLLINPLPLVNQPADLSSCSVSGAHNTFDLTTQNAVLTGGQADLTVVYYTNLADAVSQTSPITDPGNYISSISSQTLYATVTNNQGCKVIRSFEVVLLPIPLVNQVPDLYECGSDGQAVFNLTVNETALKGDQENIFFTYYTSNENAQTDENPIVDPENFESSLDHTPVFVRLKNGTCYAIATFNAIVMESPVFTKVLEFEVCSPVNLSSLSSEFSTYATSYYTSEEDALSKINAIPNPGFFPFTSDLQLYINAENKAGCIIVASLFLSKAKCEIPKGISPNGDDKNEKFDLSWLSIARLHIYNRYGMQVYEISNYTNQWHGQDEKENELPVGTYYYVIEYEDGGKSTGWVYINR